MVTFLEQYISSGFFNLFGNQMWLGVFFIGIFVAFVLMQRSSLESKVMILIPACMLAVMFIPWLFVIVGLISGFLVMGGIQKLQQQ